MSILTDNIQAMPLRDDNIKRTGAAGAIDTSSADVIYFDSEVQLNIGTTIDASDYFNTSRGEGFTVSDVASVYVNADVGYILV